MSEISRKLRVAIMLRDNPPASSADDTVDTQLLDLAREEGVLALLAAANEPGVEPAIVPDGIRRQLARHTHMLAAHELAIQHEIREVIETLLAHDLDFLLFKGTPLAYGLYPQPWLRERCDTDILLRERADAERACEILRERGYRQPNAVNGDTISTQLICSRRLASGAISMFDIHWRLNNSLSIANLFDFDALREHSVPVTDLHPRALAPAPVDALIIACLHRIAHLTQHQHNRLIWLYDIHLLSGSFSEADWKGLQERCNRWSISHAILDGLRVTRQYFDSRIPAAVIENLSSDHRRQAVHTADYTSSWRRELGQLRALPSTMQRLAHILAVLFPAPDYMIRKYHARHAWQLPWLYARRIAGGMKKRLWSRRRTRG